MSSLGVGPDQAGIAAALLNSAQQIGVALGLVVLAGVADGITADARDAGPAALVDGYSGALLVGAAILLAAAVLAVLSLDSVPTEEPASETLEHR